jgi:hypothetical protein
MAHFGTTPTTVLILWQFIANFSPGLPYSPTPTHLLWTNLEVENEEKGKCLNSPPPNKQTITNTIMHRKITVVSSVVVCLMDKLPHGPYAEGNTIFVPLDSTVVVAREMIQEYLVTADA